MTFEEKIQEILCAANSGVPLNRIDIKGHGDATRRILKGGKPGAKKIEEMYANLLTFRELETHKKTQQSLNVSHASDLNREQKITLILEAIQNGTHKSYLDPKGHGKGITRLQQGRNVSDTKIDEMYRNVLSFAGKKVAHNSLSSTCPSRNRPMDKATSVEIVISKLLERIACLEVGMQKLQKEIDKKKESNIKPPKVLGVSLLRKTDVVHGQKYSRWYGVYNLNHKRSFIYIGKDVSKAKEKIQAWLDTHVSGGSQ